jgi:hypothetical protein
LVAADWQRFSRNPRRLSRFISVFFLLWAGSGLNRTGFDRTRAALMHHRNPAPFGGSTKKPPNRAAWWGRGKTISDGE